MAQGAWHSMPSSTQSTKWSATRSKPLETSGKSTTESRGRAVHRLVDRHRAQARPGVGAEELHLGFLRRMLVARPEALDLQAHIALEPDEASCIVISAIARPVILGRLGKVPVALSVRPELGAPHTHHADRLRLSQSHQATSSTCTPISRKAPHPAR